MFEKLICQIEALEIWLYNLKVFFKPKVKLRSVIKKKIKMHIDLFLFFCLFFCFTFFGLFFRRFNILILLIFLELNLLAIIFLFIELSYYLDNINGKIITLFIITLAAAESALGLGILLTFFRTRGFIFFEGLALLKN